MDIFNSFLDWVWNVLAELGMVPSHSLRTGFSYCVGLYHKNAKILFLGLDNAGKTVCEFDFV